MFKSIYYSVFPTTDNNIIVHIIDEDFKDNILIKGYIMSAVYVDAIVSVYLRKNLNVALNIALMFNFTYRKYQWCISQAFELNKNNSNFIPYKNNVEKYLLLL